MSRRMNRGPNRRLGAVVGAGLLSVAVVLAGCAGDNADEDSPAGSSQEHGEHGGMDHPADGGPVPEGMTEATDPAYPVGTEVTLAADHMEGMDGATATIVGAYDTYTYSVDYTPTTGGDPITDHRWVVQEELADAGDERLADGTEVTLAAAHMEGMDGATATIASSTEETVYVVDFEAGGMTMTNHKWVVESEIQPAS
ncbi:YdhK family protein [Micrococcus luteus KDCGSN]|uniref:YdhK family protein n=1 Tax=Micrococcus luteus TaxID=1270 RepID=UPI0033EB6E05